MARTLEQRIANAHFRIMRHETWCAFSGIILMGSTTVVDSDEIPTACVDAGGNKFYNRQYCGALPDAELMAAVLHENLHFAFQHLTVWKKLWEEDADLAAQAADFVVNDRIVQGSDTSFAKLKPSWYYHPMFKDWSVKQVFDYLKKNGNPQKGGSGSAQPGGQDTHRWKQGKPNGQPLTQEEVKEIAKEVDKALRNGLYIAGKGKGNANRVVGDLNPTVRWQDALREFVQEACAGDDEYTWRRINRRFVQHDTYLPGSFSETMGKLVAAADMSGSTHYIYKSFIAEMLEIARAVRPSALEIIYWSDGIESIETYTPDQYDDLKSLTRPRGGGGTDVQEVADYVEKHKDEIQACVVLTDGELFGQWGQWNVPVLWAISSKRIVAPVGKTIHIDVTSESPY